MQNNSTAISPLTNHFLARLPEEDYRYLLPYLHPVKIKAGDVLYEARKPIDYAYFPVGGVLSALTMMQDGDAIEVATVGKEGLVGYQGRFAAISPHRVILQIEGPVLRIEAQILMEEAERRIALKKLLAAYQLAFIIQVSQSVACNGLHRLVQRCCRWLLTSRDRVGSNDLRLTHEFLAIMLGARRASVTEVLGPLQDAGLVESKRGRIVIVDGTGLESHACECYSVVRDEYDRLMNTAL